ncbi:MAG TPA: cohesin domain-containing protein, partial [Dehalococcoidia bacterium]
MSNKRLPIVVFLLIAVALSLVAVSRSQASHSPGAISLLYIDVDTSGNTATTLGTAEGCRSVAPLESFTIDIAIADWPANGDTLVGFEADLNYDPSVLSVTAVDYGMLLMAAGGTPVSFGEPVPDSDGIFLQSVFDIVGPEESSGGVLARITLEGQGAGQSELTLTTPGAFIGTSEANGLYVPVDAVNRAWVAVDQSCVPGVQPGPAAPPFPPSACTPGPDADANGFSDCLEAFYGTNPNLNCASPGDPDTWPPDVDGNNWVNILDPLDFRQEWRATPAGGGYSARLDLYPDLQINLTDILVLMTWWNVTCVPAPD